MKLWVRSIAIFAFFCRDCCATSRTSSGITLSGVPVGSFVKCTTRQQERCRRQQLYSRLPKLSAVFTSGGVKSGPRIHAVHKRPFTTSSLQLSKARTSPGTSKVGGHVMKGRSSSLRTPAYLSRASSRSPALFRQTQPSVLRPRTFIKFSLFSWYKSLLHFFKLKFIKEKKLYRKFKRSS